MAVSVGLKVKLPDGTVLTMSIYSSGNPEEYLAHVIAVQHGMPEEGQGTGNSVHGHRGSA